MTIYPDKSLANADWTKTSWDLPTTKDELLAFLHWTGQTVEQFEKLPVYLYNKDKFDWLTTL